MAILPNGDQPLLSGYLFGKTIAQENEILDAESKNNDLQHKLNMKDIELSKWKKYAHQLEEALNKSGADAKGVAATREALIKEGQACPLHGQHKLSHSKALRDQIYDKGFDNAEPFVKEPRR